MAIYFPNATYIRCERILELKKKSAERRQLVQDASAVYTFAIQEFWGLGAVFQFFPGSNAYAARRQLSWVIQVVSIPELEELRIQDVFRIAKNHMLIFSSFGGVLEAFIESFTRWYQEVFKQDIFKLKAARDNKKMSSAQIISALFASILRSFLTLNPFQLLEGVLIFLHSVLNRVLEIGSTQKSKSSLPRFILKALSGILIGGIQIPVKVAKYMLSFSLNLIMEPLLLLGRLLLHFRDSIKSAISNGHTASLKTTLLHLHGANDLKKEFKRKTNRVKNTLPPDSSQTHKDVDPPKAKRTYVGTSKAEITNSDKESLVVVLGAPTKIQITQLFITFFQKKAEEAKRMGKSVNEIEKEGKLTEQDIQEIEAQYTTLHKVS